MEEFSFQAEGGDAGRRLDQYLAELMEDTTRSAVQRLCDQGRVLALPVTANPSFTSV